MGKIFRPNQNQDYFPECSFINQCYHIYRTKWDQPTIHIPSSQLLAKYFKKSIYNITEYKMFKKKNYKYIYLNYQLKNYLILFEIPNLQKKIILFQINC